MLDVTGPGRARQAPPGSGGQTRNVGFDAIRKSGRVTRALQPGTGGGLLDETRLRPHHLESCSPTII